MPGRKEADTMRKICAAIAALLLLIALTVPVLGAEDDFVPSITYKGGPEIVEAKMNEEDVTACLVATSILEAKEKKTDITQAERDLLLEVYEKLVKDEMELPVDDDLVVRELVDVSFQHSECVEPEHNHKEWLARDNTSVEVKFDMGLPTDVQLEVLVYINEEWIPVEDVTVNPDKTVTVVFEDICPVAFCVHRSAQEPPAQTGDTMGRMLWLWIVLLLASIGALVYLVQNRRKFLR